MWNRELINQGPPGRNLEEEVDRLKARAWYLEGEAVIWKGGVLSGGGVYIVTVGLCIAEG